MQSQAMSLRCTIRLALLLTLLGVVASCSNPITGSPNGIPSEAEAALLTTNELELFSLDPFYRYDPLQPKSDGEGRFHDWQVLGKVTITGEAKGRILTTLQQSIPKYDNGMRVSCFSPRHGIRVHAGNNYFDFVICFECVTAVVYANDEDIGGFQINMEHEASQRVLDDELTRAGVKLPKPASK